MQRFDPAWGWEYREIPGNKPVLQARTAEILARLYKKLYRGERLLLETRPPHNVLFRGLTPEGHPYFAGHFRGEPYERLAGYPVGIDGDSRVGVVPESVGRAMVYFTAEVRRALRICRVGWALPNSHLPLKQKAIYLVKFAASLLVEFLRIHPFANGNGHISRLFLVAFLGEFGLWLRDWDVDTRPPRYGEMISMYRDGDSLPLEQFLWRQLVPREV